MKTLYLTHDIHADGGIQRYSRYQVRALEELCGSGSVLVCSLHGGEREGGPVITLAGGGPGLIPKLRFAAGVIRLARRDRPSLILATHVNLAPLAWLLARLISVPYWVNVYAIEVWGRLSRSKRHALRNAALVISDCRFTCDLLRDRFPELRDRVEVVEDCVDCLEFSPGPPRNGHERPSVLTVSRLAQGRSKGHDRVFESLARLRRDGLGFRYIVAGDGADRLRLEGRATDLGIADDVVFTGRVPDDRLPSIYRNADIFVLVSAFSLEPEAPLGEGVPLVVLEAQACGRPVITSRLDGSRESIADGRTGILVDPDDVDEIAAALRRLLVDAELRHRYGTEAALFARERFSYPVFCERHRQLLETAALA